MLEEGVLPTLMKRLLVGIQGSSTDPPAPTQRRIGPYPTRRVGGGARLHREEVSTLKKLILRVAYSAAALAALVFILGASGGKHPH
jgi:hypothetical protein